MNENKKRQTGKKENAWKRFGAAAMAGLLLIGAAAGADAWVTASRVFAEETKPEQEQEQSVSLNIAETKESESETEVQEAETKQKETYAEIERVEANEQAIVATDVSDIVENCMPSIVSITKRSVEEVETYFYGTQEYEAIGAASGIIIAQNDEELLIATNSHVVNGALELSVCFTADAEDPEDLIAPAKIKGMDKDYELAVIAVRLSDIDKDVMSQLKIAQLGSSSDLKVGQAAIAIGNALGYGQSVTSGIISALDREVTIDNFSQKLIMMDAPINSGNSGGALLNVKGQVIGINVAKAVIDNAEGMGYSIPIDTAIPVLQNLVNKETRDKKSDAERGYLGVTVVNVSADAKELYNIPAGAFVYEVTEGSAGEAAGIRKGDVITKLDGESVTSQEDLIDKISYYAVGETVTLEIQTANGGEYEAREVEVTLQKGEAVTTEETEPQTEAEDETEEETDPDTFSFPGNDFFDMFPFDQGGREDSGRY